MKKLMMIGWVAMMAGLVSAAPVLFEDFTTNPSTEVGTAALSNAAVGVWFDTTAANYNGTDGAFRMTRPGGDGGFCSLNYVLDGSLLESGQEYAVNIDYSFANNTSARLGLDIWDVDYGTGSVQAQTFRWWGSGDMNDLVTTGDATATELVDYAFWGGAWAGNIVSENFTYDGSGNIMLRINASRGDNQWFRADVSSVEVVAIPEPATLGLVSMLGAGIVYLRRRVFFD